MIEQTYLQRRMAFILNDRPLPEKKKPKAIAQKSDKRKQKEAEQKKALGDNETEKEKWFAARRKECTGICQCGCAQKSSKNDDTYFRHSIAHIFPKSKFESIMYHPLNWVERAFFGGCHTNMDDQSVSKWPLFADWDDIKERFYILAPLLTDEERATKFYSKLESLVYKKVLANRD